MAENILEHVANSPEFSLEIIQDETEEIQTENEILLFLKKYFSEFEISKIKDKNIFLVNLSLSNENLNENLSEKYIYYLNFDKNKKRLNLFYTINKRKNHDKVLKYFKEFCDGINYSLKCLTCFNKVLFINNYPEIFLAFLLQKIFENQADFIDVLKIMSFNCVPFITEEEDSSRMIQMSDNHAQSNLESENSKFIYFFM